MDLCLQPRLLAAWVAAKHMVMLWAGSCGELPLEACAQSLISSLLLVLMSKNIHIPCTLGLLLSWPGRKQILEKAQLVNWGVKGEIRHLF